MVTVCYNDLNLLLNCEREREFIFLVSSANFTKQNWKPAGPTLVIKSEGCILFMCLNAHCQGKKV